MTNNCRWTMCLVAVFVVAGLAGCEGLGSSRRSTVASVKDPAGEPKAATSDAATTSTPPVAMGLVAQPDPPFDDLPVPVGFKMVESISRSYESGGARFIDHTYQGRAGKFRVEQFCREQMALEDWKIRSAQMVRGALLIRCEKGNETCDVRITDGAGLFRMATRVSFNVQTLDASSVRSRREP